MTRTVVAAGALLAVACLAFGLLGTAAAWNGTESGGEHGMSDSSDRIEERVNETVSETVRAGRDAVEEAVDGTVDAAAGAPDGGPDSVTGSETGDGDGAADGREVDPAEVTAVVSADPADQRGPAGAVDLDVLVEVTWLAGNDRSLAVAVRTVESRDPGVPAVPSVPAGSPSLPGRDLPTSVSADDTAVTTRPATVASAGTDRGDSGAISAVDRSVPTRLGTTGPGSSAPAFVFGGTIIDALDGVAGVLASGSAVPVWAVLFLVFLKPLAGWLSALLSVLADGAGRIVAALRFGSGGEDPLEHDLRDRMYGLVEASPGITLSELADRSDASLSTVRHHVRVLERARLVQSHKIRGNRRFYPQGTEHQELIAAMEGEMSGRIIEELRARGAATVGDLVDAADRSYSTVSYHLDRLSDDGIVVKTRDGAHTISRLAPWAEAALDRSLPESAAESGHEVSAD